VSIFKSVAVGVCFSAGLFGAMPAQSAPKPETFGQLPTVYDGAISPDGQKLAVIQNFFGEYAVNVIDLNKPDAKPVVAALGKESKPKYIKWVNNDRVVVSYWQSEKIKREVMNSSFLYSLDTETLKGRILVEPRDGVRQYNDRVLDWLEDDPDHILMQFAESDEFEGWPDIRRVNVSSGRDKLVKPKTRFVYGWITDADGEPRVGSGWNNGGKDPFLTILDPTTNRWKPHTEFPGLDPMEIGISAVTDEGRSLIVNAYRGQDTRGLHRYDLVEKRFAEVIYQNKQFDVSGVILSKDGSKVMGASFTGESTERALFDEYDSTFEAALAHFNGFDVSFIDQTQDARTLLVSISAPYDPGGLYIYRAGGHAQFVLPTMEGLSPDKMGDVLSIKYPTRDDFKIPGYITLPRTITETSQLKNVPFIVLPHGGPFARDAKRFDYLAQFFANEGYGVLQMNFRGSEGYGKSFAEAGRESWVVMQNDVEDGMRWLVEKGYANPDKTCIAGWSYGGYATLMGAAKDPDLYQCAIAIAALTDIPAAMDDLRQYSNGRQIAERTFGDFMEDKALMRANNPVDVAHNITIPVFMAHGTRDTSTPLKQFTNMRKSLEKAGVDGTYMLFQGEDHYMSREENRQKMLSAISEFLDKVNGPSPFAPE
jgi:dipeptidyl aminopeptidase/acylaminoacyl peptidase